MTLRLLLYLNFCLFWPDKLDLIYYKANSNIESIPILWLRSSNPQFAHDFVDIIHLGYVLLCYVPHLILAYHSVVLWYCYACLWSTRAAGRAGRSAGGQPAASWAVYKWRCRFFKILWPFPSPCKGFFVCFKGRIEPLPDESNPYLQISAFYSTNTHFAEIQTEATSASLANICNFKLLRQRNNGSVSAQK